LLRGSWALDENDRKEVIVILLGARFPGRLFQGSFTGDAVEDGNWGRF